MVRECIKKIIAWWNGTPVYLQVSFMVAFGVSCLLVMIGVIHNTVFTYDQARDALQAYSIWHDHHLKILGPETDIPGVFHGVMWYYLLAILYAIGKTPEFVVSVFAIFTVLTIFFVGNLAWELSQNKEITISTMMLYALSSLFQLTSRWLSNPVPAFFVTPVLLLLLWKYIHKQSVWLSLWIGVCFGIIIQADFAFVLMLLSMPIYMLLFRIKTSLKDLSSFAGGLFILLSSFFIAEIKFKGQGLRGIVTFILDNHSASHTISQTLMQVGIRINEFFSSLFFSYAIVGLGVLIFFSIFTWKRIENKKPIYFLLVWLGILLLFLLFHTGISNSYFLFFPFLAPSIILISVLIANVRLKAIWFGSVVIICLLEIYTSYTFLQTNTSLLPVQQGATLSLAKNVVDYTYVAANGKPFTVITITNPLFVNTTWDYLYATYGKQYGYFPTFVERGQIGNMPEKRDTEIRYIVIEPPIGIPYIYPEKITYEESKVSDLVSEKHIGQYVVQTRRLHPRKPIPPLPGYLIGSPSL